MSLFGPADDRDFLYCPAAEYEGKYELMTLSRKVGVCPLWLASMYIGPNAHYSSAIGNGLLKKAADTYDPAQHTGMFILHTRHGRFIRAFPVHFRPIPQVHYTAFIDLEF